MFGVQERCACVGSKALKHCMRSTESTRRVRKRNASSAAEAGSRAKPQQASSGDSGPGVNSGAQLRQMQPSSGRPWVVG